MAKAGGASGRLTGDYGGMKAKTKGAVKFQSQGVKLGGTNKKGPSLKLKGDAAQNMTKRPSKRV